MPSRQISPQSFDEILSELGDDPAIQDPHGIRKIPSPKHTPPQSQRPGVAAPPTSLFSPLIAGDQIQKLGGLLAIGLILLVLAIALLFAYEHLKSTPQVGAEDLPKQIAELKKDLELLRREFADGQDSLYEEIDLLEVSIHSLKENKLIKKPTAKPKPLLYELELGRWRYLGLSQIGHTQSAFFHHARGQVMLEKGVLVLGDWRLSHMDKEAATLTHPHGKSLILKSSKSE
jgi:hypothetical protein